MFNKLFAVLLVMAFGFSCQKPPSLELQPKVQSEGTEKQKPTGTCQLFFTVERLCAEFIWENVPELKKTSSFIVKYFVQETPAKFTEPRKQPAFKLVSEGEQSKAQPLKVEKLADGEYRVSNLIFDHAGNWEIHLQLKDKDEVTDSLVKKLKIK